MDPTSDANDRGEDVDDLDDCECSVCHDSFAACAGYEPTPDQLCDPCAQALVVDLRAERDALTAELGSTKSELIADNERLRADAERWGEQSNDLGATLHRTETQLTELNKLYHVGIGDRMQLETQLTELQNRCIDLEGGCELAAQEVERLRAEVATEKKRFWDATQPELLTELREAAEAVNNSILEGDWASDAWRYVIGHMRAVLAKLPPTQLTVTEPLNLTPEMLAVGGKVFTYRGSAPEVTDAKVKP